MSESKPHSSNNPTTKADDLDSILGDLSGLSELVDDKEPDMGDIGQLSEAGSLLGDLSLLEEGDEFQASSAGAATKTAEEEINLADWGMEEQEPLPSARSDDTETMDDDNIPVLTDSVDIELPTQPMVAAADTVPLLEEEVSNGEEPGQTQMAEEEQFLLSELENIASQLSTPAESKEQTEGVVEEMPLDISLTGAMTIDEQEEIALGDLAEMSEEKGEAMSEEPKTTTAAQTGGSDFNDSEYQKLVDSLESEKAGPSSEMTASDSSLTEAVSEFTSNAAEKAGAVNANSFTAELHTQLARQIDSLLVNAINSLSDELNNHLAERMEKLLLDAVDQAMPRLMEQLSQGLRNEVQKQVSNELPSIVNEMLGKLSDK